MKRRMIIVDNDTLSQESIERAMKLVPCDICHCDRIAEALARIGCENTMSILINAHAENLDYRYVLREIRQVSPDCRIVLTSNHFDEELAELAARGQADLYVAKPFNFADLLKIVDVAHPDPNKEVL